MTTRWKLTRPAFALAAILAATTAASAGTSGIYDVDTGNYNRTNVSAAAPFGTLPVDVNLSGATAFNSLIASLTAAQNTELTQRCAVIAGAPGTYASADIQFCGSYFAYAGVTPMDPDPDAANDAGSPYLDAAGHVANDAVDDL